MADKFLYRKILEEFGRQRIQSIEIPNYLKDNLNPEFEIRPYQKEAFARFFLYYNENFTGKSYPLHLLFNMATGSGKTLVMAGLILYLYEKGYRNFLFFVNSTNIIEKTRDNFLNVSSSKFLFQENIQFNANRVNVTSVTNFEGTDENDINLCFTTIQKLHSDLNTPKENSITYQDFKDKKIVLLADEAHHMNASTKRQQEILDNSWENTVELIFNQNQDNLLLEFTATLDYIQNNIVEKYRNKVLYRYDLRDFRNDKYSKDVYIVQSDFEEKDRIILALILSQYKQEVAAKHLINLKPVILFKAQRTIEESKKNKKDFHKIIEDLSEEDISRVRNKSDLSLTKKAFNFFYANNITDRQLVERLRREFEENRCISVNEESEKREQQILLNSLEDKDNPIRAVFAVQKLNEGWDVLNLFDIVRCYGTRDAKAGEPGKTTIAEAQLIGRGARYFPFVTKDHDDRYKRKFDDNLTTELRVLEELHYHSVNNSRYISELRTALIGEGMIDEWGITKELKVKDSFKKNNFYQNGLIYLNERIENNHENVHSFSDAGLSLYNHSYSLATGRGSSEAILNDKSNVKSIKQGKSKTVKVKNIPIHITKSSLAGNDFFSFKSIKRYFPNIQSVHQFIKDENYLGGLEITFSGNPSELSSLSHKAQLDAITALLKKIESDLRKNTKKFKGTEVFKLNNLNSVFTDKSIKLNERTERADGDEKFVSERDWYVFNANYGTSEEKAFVHFIDREINTLKEKYDGIYLVRNERHFKIYSFEDGEAFEPDFVLFLREKDGNMLTYQIFAEPKGNHLKERDKWKESFLQQMTKKLKGEVFEFKTQSKTKKYKLIGVPFYNKDNENKFKENLYKVLENKI